MEKLYLLSPLFLALLLAAAISAQTSRTPLDDFLDNSEAILVVRCSRAGPVNILGRSRVDLEVLHVAKGDPKMTTLSLTLRAGMQPGSRYLVRLERLRNDKRTPSTNAESETIIPIWEGEKLDELRLLSPRIIVLRTINLRINDLESIIRQSTFELEPLIALKKGN